MLNFENDWTELNYRVKNSNYHWAKSKTNSYSWLLLFLEASWSVVSIQLSRAAKLFVVFWTANHGKCFSSKKLGFSVGEGDSSIFSNKIISLYFSPLSSSNFSAEISILVPPSLQHSVTLCDVCEQTGASQLLKVYETWSGHIPEWIVLLEIRWACFGMFASHYETSRTKQRHILMA